MMGTARAHVSHGENPTLDDSSRETVREGSETPNDAVWRRREIGVPQNSNPIIIEP
jgi:hypothetical protein